MRTPRKDAIDMRGKRFGKFTVVCFAEKRVCPSGQPKRLWWATCDCGELVTVDGAALRAGTTRQCQACARVSRAEKLKVRLGRKTLATIAKRAGISMDAIYQRRCRGWSVERLGEPLHPPGRAP